MYLHGSRNELNVGDILVPGEGIGKSDNGGHSKHVYITATDGYSLSECEEGNLYSRTFEYAVAEALYWGGERYVYVVEPLGKVSYDETDLYSASSFKTDKAKILNKYEWKELTSDLSTFVPMIENSYDEEKIGGGLVGRLTS